jgi:hypothetical protein
MRLHGGSFLLGVMAASLVPVLTRFFRPVAVQLTTAGMTAFDEARRVAAEQLEIMQDIAAEARARRDEFIEAQADAETTSDGRQRSSKPRRRATAQERKGAQTTGDPA